MLSLLVISNLRLTEEELISKTQLRVNSAIPLLNAALATPLMQGDYGTLHEILEEARGNDGQALLLQRVKQDDPDGSSQPNSTALAQYYSLNYHVSAEYINVVIDEEEKASHGRLLKECSWRHC